MTTSAPAGASRVSDILWTPPSSASSRARSGRSVPASIQESATPAKGFTFAIADVVLARARSGITLPPDIGRSTASWSVPAFTIPSTSRSYPSASPVRQGRSPEASGGRPHPGVAPSAAATRTAAIIAAPPRSARRARGVTGDRVPELAARGEPGPRPPLPSPRRRDEPREQPVREPPLARGARERHELGVLERVAHDLEPDRLHRERVRPPERLRAAGVEERPVPVPRERPHLRPGIAGPRLEHIVIELALQATAQPEHRHRPARRCRDDRARRGGRISWTELLERA